MPLKLRPYGAIDYCHRHCRRRRRRRRRSSSSSSSSSSITEHNPDPSQKLSSSALSHKPATILASASSIWPRLGLGIVNFGLEKRATNAK